MDGNRAQGRDITAYLAAINARSGMNHSDKQHISDLVHLLRQYGLQEAVICPGSRSAPLTLAFARQPDIRCSTVIDERSAGYIALGKSLASQQATVLVCTSGTALLNFAPAIAEAFYLRVPLLVLSADRPAAWVDQLDGQTIRQTDALAPHTVFTATLPERADTPGDRWHAARLVQEAWTKAHQLQGPVHLNIPLREPLYEALPPVVDLPDAVQLHQPEQHTWADDALLKRWQAAESILLVPGQQAPDPDLQEALSRLAQDPRVVILSEPVANLPGHLHQHEALLATHPARLRPDLMISWGGQVVAKQLKRWLRSFPPAEHWRIDPLAQLADPFQGLHRLVQLAPRHFFAQLAQQPFRTGDYRQRWEHAQSKLQAALQPFFEQLPFGDLLVTAQLAQLLQRTDQLQLGNSTPIRYWQMLPEPPELSWLHANRGTSGIDGVNSTALGFASQRAADTWLLTGELSFVYDLNAFSSSERPNNLKIVVVNNGGGDIFRLIDGPTLQPEREAFFSTPRQMSIEALAKGWGLSYQRASDLPSLKKGLHQLRAAKECAILEVFTEPTVNQSVYIAYQQLIKSIQ